MLIYNVLIIFYILINISSIKCDNRYVKCETHLLSTCPDHASCTPIDTNSNAGQCECLPQYTYNPNYKDLDGYCYFLMKTTRNPASQTRQQDDKNSIRTQNPPSSHHIISGILIPIFIVLIVIGLIYANKRLNLFQRAREMMITRRNRPFYQDVVNENDDPPLI